MSLSIPRSWQVLALLMFGLTPALAAPGEMLRVTHSEGEYSIPLGWLNQQNRAPLELRGANARKEVSLPVARRIEVEEARLEMVYTTSISMLPRSQLAVTLDERVIAQLPVKAHQPDNAARIKLPEHGFRPGYRILGFRAAQHYTNECEDPASPELYSQIDAEQSILRLKTSRRPITPSLARLTDVFDRRLWLDRYTLELMVPAGALAQSAALRQAAAQVSQAVAGIFDFIPVSVHVNELSPRSAGLATDRRRFPGVPQPEKAWDGVLLGTRDQLAPFVHPDILQRIREGYLGIFPMDGDPTRALLLVSGVTPDQVREAATLLNLPGLALPDRAEVSISGLRLDQGYQRRAPVDEDEGWTRFARLGFNTTTLKGMYPDPARLEFWSGHQLPDPRERFIEMELKLAYGAGFDKKSGLNVFVNNQFIHAVPMRDPNGEIRSKVKIKIPGVSLRPGVNELKFVPSVIGEDVGGACIPIFTENLLISIFEDSRIKLPALSDAMSLPDLSLMARTGLPYTRMADAQGVGVMVTDVTPKTLGSALTLIAKFRQVHKAPLTALRLMTAKDALQDRTALLVVGPERTLPKVVHQEMKAFMPKQRWQSIRLGSFQGMAPNGLLAWFTQKVGLDLPSTRKPAKAEVVLSEGLGESVALVQYVSPSMDMPVSVLTAVSDQGLQAGVEGLIEHALWGAMQGSAMMWTLDGEIVATAQPTQRTVVGDRYSMLAIIHTAANHPWILIAVTLALILLTATLSWWLLRRRARRLQGVTSDTQPGQQPPAQHKA